MQRGRSQTDEIYTTITPDGVSADSFPRRNEHPRLRPSSDQPGEHGGRFASRASNMSGASGAADQEYNDETQRRVPVPQHNDMPRTLASRMPDNRSIIIALLVIVAILVIVITAQIIKKRGEEGEQAQIGQNAGNPPLLPDGPGAKQSGQTSDRSSARRQPPDQNAQPGGVATNGATNGGVVTNGGVATGAIGANGAVVTNGASRMERLGDRILMRGRRAQPQQDGQSSMAKFMAGRTAQDDMKQLEAITEEEYMDDESSRMREEAVRQMRKEMASEKQEVPLPTKASAIVADADAAVKKELERARNERAFDLQTTSSINDALIEAGVEESPGFTRIDTPPTMAETLGIAVIAVGIDPGSMVIESEDEIPTCTAVLQTGRRVGQMCGRRAFTADRCKQHSASK